MAPRATPLDLFAGEGEMRALCRTKRWPDTPLGPVEAWSRALRTTVRTTLASPFPISLWCGDELILLYNDAYRRILGAKHPGALGRPASEIWEEIWDQLGPLAERVRGGGPPAYVEDAPFEIRRSEEDSAEPPEPTEVWLTFSLSPVRGADEPVVAIHNIVSETTDRVLSRRRAERAEARLLQVFEHAPAFLAVFRGPWHVFTYVNDAYRTLVGRRDLVGRPALEALPEVQWQAFGDYMNRVLDTGRPLVGRETPIDLARGAEGELERRYLDFVYYPLEEPEGAISGVIMHGYDVTEHVRAREEAERASRAKTDFLRTMSHDFRTPINAILGYTDLLREEISGPLNETQRKQLDRVRASTRHLHVLAGDVLDLARVEAGGVDLDVREVPLLETVEEALALVRPQARRKGVSLVSECRDRWLGYRGDADRVRQILVNLLDNAVEFTSSGGDVCVTCGTDPSRSGPEGRDGVFRRDGGEAGGTVSRVVTRPPDDSSGRGDSMVFIRVSDTGVGIEPERMERIFEPFDRGGKQTGGTRRGTGLGLTIARELAALMGGRIAAESVVGEGSAFTLWLPG